MRRSLARFLHVDQPAPEVLSSVGIQAECYAYSAFRDTLPLDDGHTRAARAATVARYCR